MQGDLSSYHSPATGLFPWPVTRELFERYRLSRDQVEFFRENGYLKGIRILEPAQLEQLRRELAEISDPSHPANTLFYEFHSNESSDPARVLFHALGAWRVAPGLHDILWHPAFTVPASQLLAVVAPDELKRSGADSVPVRFWHDQIFAKPAQHGGIVAWHQDYSYWTRVAPLAHLTCWIGLDDSTRQNGCVQYVPGSHRWPLLPRTGLADNMEAILDVLTPEQCSAFRPVPIELEAGEASFHHPLTLHGSDENRTDRPRRAVVLNVMADGVRSATAEPLLQNVPPIESGAKLEGRFFPLLLDPAGLD